MSKKISVLLLSFLAACSSVERSKTVAPTPAKEFAQGEVILATQLLTKIFDQEMAPLACVPDTAEASLLLRTIQPRMDLAQDDLEAKLDSSSEIDQMIENCEKDCTCSFVEELFREHQVTLTKAQSKSFTKKKAAKDLNRCLSYIQGTFCQSDLYKTLNEEKKDFSFDEEESP